LNKCSEGTLPTQSNYLQSELDSWI